MKYIILNDISFIINNRKKIVFSYFLIANIYFWYHVLIGSFVDIYLLYKTLSLDHNSNSGDWLETLMYVYSITIYIYIALSLLTKDLKNSAFNIFLRIDIRKWILFKIFSIHIISVLILTCMYVLVILPNYMNLLSFNLYILLIKNILYIFVIQNVIIVLFALFSKFKMAVPFTMILILTNIFVFPTSVLGIDGIAILVLFFVTDIFLLIIYKMLFVNIFENN